MRRPAVAANWPRSLARELERGQPINAPPAPPCRAFTRVFGLVSSCCARAVNESACIGLDKMSGWNLIWF
jgi:hypothetical protein